MLLHWPLPHDVHDSGGIGGGDDGSNQQGVQQLQPQQQVQQQSQGHSSDGNPQGCQGDGGAGIFFQAVLLGVEAAVKEDEQQGDICHVTGHGVVVQLDEVQAVGSRQHSDEEEYQQHRQAELVANL